MRALVDISSQYIKALGAICATRKLSRAEAVRQAIAAHVTSNSHQAAQAFGLWKNHKKDGLAYQKKVRAEW